MAAHRGTPKWELNETKHKATMRAKQDRIEMHRALLKMWEYAKEPDVEYIRGLRRRLSREQVQLASMRP